MFTWVAGFHDNIWRDSSSQQVLLGDKPLVFRHLKDTATIRTPAFDENIVVNRKPVAVLGVSNLNDVAALKDYGVGVRCKHRTQSLNIGQRPSE